MNITTLRVAPLTTQSSSIAGNFLQWKQRISLIFCGDSRHYCAESIEHRDHYYCRALGVTVVATPYKYSKVIRNSKLYYFSAALKLHQRIAGAKVLGLGLDWPTGKAAPTNIFNVDKPSQEKRS